MSASKNGPGNVLARLKQIQAGKLDPTSLDKDQRYAVVVVLVEDGYSTAQIASINPLFDFQGRLVIGFGALQPGDLVVIEGNERLHHTAPVVAIEPDVIEPGVDDTTARGGAANDADENQFGIARVDQRLEPARRDERLPALEPFVVLGPRRRRHEKSDRKYDGDPCEEPSASIHLRNPPHS